MHDEADLEALVQAQPPLVVKGGAEPLRMWLVEAPRCRAANRVVQALRAAGRALLAQALRTFAIQKDGLDRSVRTVDAHRAVCIKSPEVRDAVPVVASRNPHRFGKRVMKSTVLSLLIAGASLASNAAPVVLNFDEFVVAPGGSVDISTRYTSLGVTFSNAEVVSGLPIVGSSVPNVLWSRSDNGYPQPAHPIVATFGAAQQSVSVTGLDIGNNGFILNAYDAETGGSLVDSVQFVGVGTGDDVFRTLTVDAAAIRRVEFSQVFNLGGGFGDLVLFDDFTFVPAAVIGVPEPGTQVLAGLALFALGLARRAGGGPPAEPHAARRRLISA